MLPLTDPNRINRSPESPQVDPVHMCILRKILIDLKIKKQIEQSLRIKSIYFVQFWVVSIAFS